MMKSIHNSVRGEIVLYRKPGGGTSLDVRLRKETLWLTQAQIADLFQKERSVITKHLRNIFDTGELVEKSNVQKMHIPNSDKPVAFYNLDVIISVGYRVNSKIGTQFRIWATKVLKDHLVKGYTVHQKRLRELKQTVRLISEVAARKALTGDEAQALLKVVGDYTYALDLLDDYDHQRIRPAKVSPGKAVRLEAEEARGVVQRLRDKFGGSDLFGKERGGGLEATLGAVAQTCGGRDLYRSLEEKGANLLYLLVKNHPFVDGNKRIGAALFLWFMEKNGALYRADGFKRIADNALVAMTLLIAESNPREKEILTGVMVNLIDRRN